jgi:2-polyprenyl-3-methyl-5-hydroxy-6-metoxy-1,4-benzoquinol methylase
LLSVKPPLLWLRYENEARACPACESPHIALLDVFKIPRDRRGRRLAFLSGCHECGVLFVNPLPSQDELDERYAPQGAWAETRKVRAAKPAVQPATRDPRAVLLDALEPYVPVHSPPPGTRVIDFGCGEGKFLDRLQDAGWETFGIEPSTAAPYQRHRRLDQPPRDGSFDFAILHHVLEHVTNPLQILRALAGAVRDGGVLFVGVPALDTLPVHGDFKYCVDGRNHLLSYSRRCLAGLLARAGFATVARLEGAHLDALTKGKPLRLRVVARRTHAPVDLEPAPLTPAVDAVNEFARSRRDLAARVRSTLPVRIQGAMLDRAVERRARARRHAQS